MSVTDRPTKRQTEASIPRQLRDCELRASDIRGDIAKPMCRVQPVVDASKLARVGRVPAGDGYETGKTIKATALEVSQFPQTATRPPVSLFG
jgi:hypothetical protein